MNSFPTLHTSRLNLVETTSAHLAGLFRLVTDEQVKRFFNVMPATKVEDMQATVDRFKKAYDEQTGLRWAITLDGKPDLIGTIGLYTYTPKHRGVLAYALIPEYWNKGYLTEALNEILKYGFNELQLNRIDAEIRPGNVPSEQILLKHGFNHEGLLRDWTLWNGEYQDMNMYALLAKEWRARQAASL